MRRQSGMILPCENLVGLLVEWQMITAPTSTAAEIQNESSHTRIMQDISVLDRNYARVLPFERFRLAKGSKNSSGEPEKVSAWSSGGPDAGNA